jgi:hypothetical protein
MSSHVTSIPANRESQPVVVVLSMESIEKLASRITGLKNRSLSDIDHALNRIFNKIPAMPEGVLLVEVKGDEIGLARESTLREILDKIPTLPGGVLLVSISGDEVGLARESTLTSIKDLIESNSDYIRNLDVGLSTRASESTLSGIKTKIDRLRFDENDNLMAVVNNIPTDYFKSGQPIGESPFNLVKVSGTPLTARDWSSDFEKLQNIDVQLSTRASEATLNAVKSNTDNLDVPISTLASESTLSSIKSKIDRLSFDEYNNLKVVVPAAPEPIYVAPVSASAVAASKHHISLWNGSTSYKVKIKSIIVGMHSTATVSGYIMQFIAYRASSISGGTALTIDKLDPDDPNLPSGISATTGSTVTVTGPPLAIFTVNPEETGGFAWIYFTPPKEIVIKPSTGFTIQQYATAGVGLFNAVIYFSVASIA